MSNLALFALLYLGLLPSKTSSSHLSQTFEDFTLPSGKPCTAENSHDPDRGHDLFRASFVDFVVPAAGYNSSLTFKLEFLDTASETWITVKWSDTVLVHGRKLHVVIVGEDLDVFIHVHPDDFQPVGDDATAFTVSSTFPRGGQYVVALQYALIAEVQELCIAEAAGHFHSYLNCPNPWPCAFPLVSNLLHLAVTSSAQDAMTPFVEDLQVSKTVAPLLMTGTDQYIHPIKCAENEAACDASPSTCYTVTLAANSIASMITGQTTEQTSGTVPLNTCLYIHVEFTDSSGSGATLTPYLDAEAHLVFVHQDLQTVQHLHALAADAVTSKLGNIYDTLDLLGCVLWHDPQRAVPEEFGPAVAAIGTFTKAGTYKLFVTTTTGNTWMLHPSFQRPFHFTRPSSSPPPHLPPPPTPPPNSLSLPPPCSPPFVTSPPPATSPLTGGAPISSLQGSLTLRGESTLSFNDEKRADFIAGVAMSAVVRTSDVAIQEVTDVEAAEARLRSLLEEMHGLSIQFIIATANEEAATQASSALEQSITDGTFQAQLAQSEAYDTVEVSDFTAEIIIERNSVEELAHPPPFVAASSPDGASQDDNMPIYISATAGALLIVGLGAGGAWYRHRRCQARGVIPLHQMSDEGTSHDGTKALSNDVEECHELESTRTVRRDAW
ncbi:hypothetical protein CYMTET_54851 [Cymbomonas tetramitiformis]|uniref:Uncharacterized protein n=1 Tax=Cymbomonas tetramitiformis TaxID=36881 RepID=A0AAE0BFW9_9CHLO|nr:hypothetical protein CYMTET_54851 [Cymbomonas tetramitiformis]